MIIKSVRVRNFRCIRDETLECENLTVLVGQNGSGKSSFLRAIELFYDLQVRPSEEDYYNRNVDQPIIITITFGNLTPEEMGLYAAYLDGNTLTVDKQISYPGGKGNEKYFGSRMQNPDFQEVRATSPATAMREAYRLLQEQYSELPNVSRVSDVEPALLEWEQSHAEDSQRIPDSGQFFGFKEVGNARLERFTKFLLIPAVKDASDDAEEGRGSLLTDLMDLVVRHVLLQKPELEQFKANVREQYRELVAEDKIPELPQLAYDLTKTLQTYTPDAEVALDWLIGEPNIPTPTASANLVEDEYKGAVSKKGHGLQRAFILTLLQYLATVRLKEGAEEQGNNDEVTDDDTVPSSVVPNLVIAIEEPELYQHPNRQRHLAKVFMQLAEGGLEGGERVQLLYTTHSPLFVSVERFNEVRLLRKEKNVEELPRETKTRFVTKERIAEKIDEARGLAKGTSTATSIEARLARLMTPWMNEGFFANTVVLVEGESDYSTIVEVARQIGVSLEKAGISVIPVHGKSSLAIVHLIFTEFGISSYVIFDCDDTKEDRHSELLLQLCGCSGEALPKTIVKDNMACFEDDLEAILSSEIGEQLYQELIEQYAHEFGYSVKRAAKNPVVISRVVQEAYEKGKKIETIENIVNSIVALKK